jgi:hypothetical protein
LEVFYRGEIVIGVVFRGSDGPHLDEALQRCKPELTERAIDK